MKKKSDRKPARLVLEKVSIRTLLTTQGAGPPTSIYDSCVDFGCYTDSCVAWGC